MRGVRIPDGIALLDKGGFVPYLLAPQILRLCPIRVVVWMLFSDMLLDHL